MTDLHGKTALITGSTRAIALRYAARGAQVVVDEVADAVEYFAGPLAHWISGQHLLISGGAQA